MKEKVKKAFAPVRSIYDKASAKTVAISTAAGIGAMTIASSAFAGDLEDLFTSADVTGANAATKTFITGLILIGVLFFGRRLLRRLGVSI